MDGARRRRDALAGLTLGAVLGDEKEMPPPPPRVNRTLLDIIREEEPNSRAYKSLIHHHHNKKSWKSFKDRLRIKRAGAAWSNVPASDVPIYNDLVITGPIAATTTPASDDDRRPTLAQLSRHHSIRVSDPVEPFQFDEVQQAETGQGQGQVQLQNQSLSRVVSLQTDLTQEDSLHIEHVPVSDVPIMSSRSSMLRRNSSRISSSGQPDEPVRSVRLSEALAAEREQIQRVVSSTEAAGRARQQEEEAESGTGNEEAEVGGEVAGDDEQQQQQVRMSLMDLLEDTDRQMGWSYSGGDGDGCHDDDDEEDEAEKEEAGSNLVERNCCVCMVRHKGSAFIPCGHTFCRLCSRELWVSRGNCPLCNGFILEILDIF